MSGGTENDNGDQDQDDGVNISSPALKNEVILDIIFAMLGTPALKSVRHVCHLWSDLVTSRHLAKKTILSIKKIFPCDVILSRAPQFNQKLAKQIQVDECYKNKKCELVKTDPSFGYNFDLVVPLFCNSVEKMCLRVDGAGPFVPHFIRALQQNNFPKLKEISIEYILRAVIMPDDAVAPNSDVSTNRQLNFRALPSLKVFKFIATKAVQYAGSIVLHSDMDYDEGCVKFRSILSAILVAASNLAELEFSDVFCPNLSSCRKLKTLKFNQQFNRREVDLRMAAINEMLITVKDSLEKFDLDFEDPCEYEDLNVPRYVRMCFVQVCIVELMLIRGRIPPQALHLKFPEMPNLVSLTLREVHDTQLINCLDQIRLPNLKKLNILDERWFHMSLDTIQKTLSTPNQLITSLHLGIISTIPGDTIPIFDNLFQLFPSVKTFQMGFRLALFKADQFTWLKQIVSTFHSWDLERLELIFSEVEVDLIPMVVEFLITMKALKTITFSVINKELNSLSILSSDQVKEAFISCKRLERVTVVVDKENNEVIEEIEAFVLEHTLPIEFQWPEIRAQISQT